jgi:hypothetical protein
VLPWLSRKVDDWFALTFEGGLIHGAVGEMVCPTVTVKPPVMCFPSPQWLGRGRLSFRTGICCQTQAKRRGDRFARLRVRSRTELVCAHVARACLGANVAVDVYGWAVRPLAMVDCPLEPCEMQVGVVRGSARIGRRSDSVGRRIAVEARSANLVVAPDKRDPGAVTSRR